MQETPQCSICGEAAPAPLRRLPAEEREGWVALGGRSAHRRCAVARKLEEARLEKERASFRRARQEAYPLPREGLQAQNGSELRRVGSGKPWANTGERAGCGCSQQVTCSPARPAPSIRTPAIASCCAGVCVICAAACGCLSGMEACGPALRR